MKSVLTRRGSRRTAQVLADSVPDPGGIVGSAAKAQRNLNIGAVEGVMHSGGTTSKAGRYKLAKGEKVKVPAKPAKKVPSEGIYNLVAGTKVTPAKDRQPPAGLHHEAAKMWQKSQSSRRHALLILKSEFAGRKT